MDIPLQNIFFGFVNHFASFYLDRFDFYYGNTKSTNRVLNYFASLGETLGFISELELGKMDLV